MLVLLTHLEKKNFLHFKHQEVYEKKSKTHTIKF